MTKSTYNIVVHEYNAGVILMATGVTGNSFLVAFQLNSEQCSFTYRYTKNHIITTYHISVHHPIPKTAHVELWF